MTSEAWLIVTIDRPEGARLDRPLPEPEDPQALSAREREILAAIEIDLTHADPDPARGSSGARAFRTRCRRVQLSWFVPALVSVIVVAVVVPALLPPLAVLLFVAVVLQRLSMGRRLP